MNASLIVDGVIKKLRSRYGKARQLGRSSVFIFRDTITCSINYSKLLRGQKFFFGITTAMADASKEFEKTTYGEFVLLVCGSPDSILVLPRRLILEMLSGVPSRRIDVFVEDGTYILQTTKHPKMDVSGFLNTFPAEIKTAEPDLSDDKLSDSDSRDHVRIQSSLMALGRAEGCKVWVPTNDRNLAFRGQSFSDMSLGRLPNFGFDENTRRIVQNIDVLWLSGNVIRKAFEIESTTSIYSGLLRLNDLALAQPNNQIDMYIAAPERRKTKVFDQLTRLSFRPLLDGCRFVSFDEIDKLTAQLSALNLRAASRITGLIEGEAFSLPEHFVYPSNL